jgi:trehalose 2-sulfotransferase
VGAGGPDGRLVRHLGQPPSEDPRFDFDQINALARAAAAHKVAWESWVAANGLQPFTVRYEDLVLDKVGITRRILDFLDLDGPSEGLVIAEQTRRQGDPLNERWIARYRRLAAERDVLR